MLESDAVTDAIVGFHCQQTVEKATKAVLAAAGADFPFTHDLGGLIELCEEAGASVPPELEDVDRLTP
jgi:HEPN domain-containing protein